MSKLKLGGIKAFEKRTYLTSSCRSGGDALREICTRLAADHINLNLLTHIADNGVHRSITAACTGDTEGFASYIHWKESHGECSVGKLLRDVSMISVFPHHQQLDVIGYLLCVLGEKSIRLHGLASSPSAMTALVSAADFEESLYGLFEVFEFPTYSSPLDWHAAYRGQEELLSDIICSYEEELIKVYDVTHHDELDLWHFTLPPAQLADLGRLLLTLHESHVRAPFLISETSQDDAGLCFAFGVAAACRAEVGRLFEQALPSVEVFFCGPASVFFLQGPHFGDRHGIASTLVRSLDLAGIIPLAVSCAVSSMSVMVKSQDSPQIIEALHSKFLIPAGKA